MESAMKDLDSVFEVVKEAAEEASKDVYRLDKKIDRLEEHGIKSTSLGNGRQGRRAQLRA